MHCPFRGSLAALPTPFRDGRLDLEAFEELVETHVVGGTDGLVVAGTTGEAATLSEGERTELLRAAVRFAARRLPVIAGVGTNCTDATEKLGRRAAATGVDGLLVVTPYYNKPSRRGLLLHFGAVARATELPILLYNVPSRTGVDLAPAIAAELRATHPSIVGIKEAHADPARVSELLETTDLAVFSGNDDLAAECLARGAHGVIGVVANLVPAEMAELCRVARPGGDERRARELWDYLSPLARDLFIEVNPVPVKVALARKLRFSEDVRPPLAPLEDESRARLESTLRAYGWMARETGVPRRG